MNDVRDNAIYYPMLVSNAGTAEPLSRAEDALIWKKYLTLPQQKRNILTADELPVKLQELQQKFSLNEEIIGKVSLGVRMLFFGEIDLHGCEAKVGSILELNGGGDPNRAREIAQFIDREILHLVPAPVIEEKDEEENPQGAPALVRLPLLQAMGKYPRLGDQNVTTDRIKLRGALEPARGSLSSWIKYYRDELGIGFHDQVQRGRFLFQSENGKHLSGEERDRLNLILKSIEEDFPLEIDTVHQMIIFPAPEKRILEMPVPPVTPLAREMISRSAYPPVSPSTPRAFIPTPPSPSFIGIGSKPVSASASSFAEPGSNQGGVMEIKRRRETEEMPASILSEFGGGATPGKNIAGDTLHFSTGHVFPAEHEPTAPIPHALSPQSPAVASSQTPSPSLRPAEATRSVSPGRTIPPRSPYSIRPLRLRNDQ
ncbi:MAG: hypothetical protein ABI747_01650 [Candidatus Moraniibacteriota bacterium]